MRHALQILDQVMKLEPRPSRGVVEELVLNEVQGQALLIAIHSKLEDVVALVMNFGLAILANLKVARL